MALSIKNPRAGHLAMEVARETGETMTQAVICALEERLERLRDQQTLADTIMAISARCSALPDVDPRSADEILAYDLHGLTR